MSRLSVNDPQVVSEAATAIGVELGGAGAITVDPEVASQDNVQDALEALENAALSAAAVTGERDDPESALATLLTVLDSLGIIDDQTTETGE